MCTPSYVALSKYVLIKHIKHNFRSYLLWHHFGHRRFRVQEVAALDLMHCFNSNPSNQLGIHSTFFMFKVLATSCLLLACLLSASAAPQMGMQGYPQQAYNTAQAMPGQAMGMMPGNPSSSYSSNMQGPYGMGGGMNGQGQG